MGNVSSMYPQLFLVCNENDIETVNQLIPSIFILQILSYTDCKSIFTTLSLESASSWY